MLSRLQKFLAGTFEVEFLVHRKGGCEEIVTVSKYNVNAQSLPFLDLLFIEPIMVHHSDFKVRLPSPEALFLHKLIIAQRRKKESKRAKDLEQCATIAPHLDTVRLAEMAQNYKMGRETKRSILASCKGSITNQIFSDSGFGIVSGARVPLRGLDLVLRSKRGVLSGYKV
jgi:hypothetical protein